MTLGPNTVANEEGPRFGMSQALEARAVQAVHANLAKSMTPQEATAYIDHHFQAAYVYEADRRASIRDQLIADRLGDASSADELDPVSLAHVEDEAGIIALRGTCAAPGTDGYRALLTFSWFMCLPHAGFNDEQQDALARAFIDEITAREGSQPWYNAQLTMVRMINEQIELFEQNDANFRATKLEIR